MIIDVNAFLGHYPFRQLRNNSAAAFVAHLDRNGIDRAVVSSLHAVFYRDAHRGNEELFAETRAHASRLIPVATVNPKYVGWERDLAECVEQWKMKVVTLLPEHHGYSLSDAQGRAALAKIAEYGLPVLLTQRLEDRRQRHAFDRAEDLQLNAVLEAAQAYPRLKFMLVNWAGLDGKRLVDAGLKGRCLIDFARLQVVFRKDVPKLIETLGVEAIAFGSQSRSKGSNFAFCTRVEVPNLRDKWRENFGWNMKARFITSSAAATIERMYLAATAWIGSCILEIAAAMKTTTTAPNPWLASQLNMGSLFRLCRVVSTGHATPAGFRPPVRRIPNCKA